MRRAFETTLRPYVSRFARSQSDQERRPRTPRLTTKPMPRAFASERPIGRILRCSFLASLILAGEGNEIERFGAANLRALAAQPVERASHDMSGHIRRVDGIERRGRHRPERKPGEAREELVEQIVERHCANHGP